MNSVAILSLFFGLSCFVNGDSGNNQCEAEMSAGPPDPKTQCCGITATPKSKTLGRVTIQVDEFPWLALIEYEKDGLLRTPCGGSLISGKFVLTAAHCVSGQILEKGNPINIRLGEFDISRDGPDCAPEDTGSEHCTDGAIRIPIEKIILHPEYIPRYKLDLFLNPNYNPISAFRRHDIALINMKKLAPYTNFIRPICLPSMDITLNTSPFTLVLAAWQTSLGPSPTVLRLDLPFVSREKCQPAYAVDYRKIPLIKGQFCAGGKEGKDSCNNDGGIPLVYDNKNTAEVAGIVSLGVHPCGLKDVPTIYTNVYEYLPWIKSHVTESSVSN